MNVWREDVSERCRVAGCPEGPLPRCFRPWSRVWGTGLRTGLREEPQREDVYSGGGGFAPRGRWFVYPYDDRTWPAASHIKLEDGSGGTFVEWATCALRGWTREE